MYRYCFFRLQQWINKWVLSMYKYAYVIWSKYCAQAIQLQRAITKGRKMRLRLYAAFSQFSSASSIGGRRQAPAPTLGDHLRTHLCQLASCSCHALRSKRLGHRRGKPRSLEPLHALRHQKLSYLLPPDLLHDPMVDILRYHWGPDNHHTAPPTLQAKLPNQVIDPWYPYICTYQSLQYLSAHINFCVASAWQKATNRHSNRPIATNPRKTWQKRCFGSGSPLKKSFVELYPFGVIETLHMRFLYTWCLIQEDWFSIHSLYVRVRLEMPVTLLPRVLGSYVVVRLRTEAGSLVCPVWRPRIYLKFSVIGGSIMRDWSRYIWCQMLGL